MNRYYLTLSERLSQIYLNYVTVCLIIIIIKLYLFKTNIVSQLETLTDFNLCDKDADEKRYEQFSTFVNQQINKTVNTLQKTNLYFIQLLIICIKNMILFYIELFLGTYTCLLNAVINATANFAVDSSEKVIVGVNETIVAVSNDIQLGLKGLSSVINQLISGANAIKNFFSGTGINNGSEYSNKINLSIDALKKIAIPSSVLTDIDTFRRDTLPDFTNLENLTQSLITLPFQSIQRKLNDSILKTKSTLNNESMAIFKVNNPLCGASSNFEQMTKTLVRSVEVAAKIIIIVLLICAVASIIPIAIGEWSNNRHRSRLMYDLNASGLKSPTSINNTIDRNDNKILYYVHKWGIIQTNQGLWLASYITTPLAFFVLLLGLGGLILVGLQFIILKKLENILKTISSSIMASANLPSDFKQATVDYVESTNKNLVNFTKELNSELFGNIKQVSLAINSTLETFWTNLNGTIHDIFGKTVFSGPINTVVYCTIGRKIIKFEQGLTWINDNLSISIPKLNENDFEDIDKFLTNDLSNFTSHIERGLSNIIKLQKKGLKIEMTISLSFVGMWFFQIIIGVIIILVRNYIFSNQNDSSISSIIENIEPSHSTNTFESSKFITTDKISNPIPLTTKQRLHYGYTLSNPLEVYNKGNISKSYII